MNAEHKDERLRFPGALEAKFTTDCKFADPKDIGVVPCYRVIDSEGKIVDENYKRDFSDEEAIKLYLDMVGVSIMDLICLDAQRQGMLFVCCYILKLYTNRLVKVVFLSTWFPAVRKASPAVLRPPSKLQMLDSPSIAK